MRITHTVGRILISCSIAFVLAAAGPATAATASVPLTASATSTVMTTYAARIVYLTNRQRAAAGLPALRVSTCATSFARAWSNRMSTTGRFAHQSLSPILTTCRARAVGENIAYGARTPEQMMAMWMASSGHRANILRRSFTHIGVGAARTRSGVVYATQDFLTL